MSNLILASASPRRREILAQMGFSFEVLPSHCEEIIDPLWSPATAVQKLAEQKAQFVSNQEPNKLVLGSDTVVVFKNKILGKPKDEAQAFEWLMQMQGNQHTVFTGVAICKNGTVLRSDFEETKVYFNPQDPKGIRNYLKLQEYTDKAGAYGIQGYGCRLVERIDGCYFNVMGLPIAKTLELLKYGET